jgi:uncharacterized protein (TIGR00106 family)
MLAELSIIPWGGARTPAANSPKCLKLVEKSGLPYQLTPSATCIEGEWDQIMPLIRQCHERARKDSAHIVTFIKLEEDDGERDKLIRNVTSVEEKLGHRLHSDPRKTREEK